MNGLHRKAVGTFRRYENPGEKSFAQRTLTRTKTEQGSIPSERKDRFVGARRNELSGTLPFDDAGKKIVRQTTKIRKRTQNIGWKIRL